MEDDVVSCWESELRRQRKTNSEREIGKLISVKREMSTIFRKGAEDAGQAGTPRQSGQHLL
jgi:hypothetical protein